MSDRMEHARLWLSPRTGGRARKRRPTRGAKRHRFSLEEMQAGAYEFPYLPWIRGTPEGVGRVRLADQSTDFVICLGSPQTV